jgi:Flp pilus assembly protein TadG
MTATRAGRVLGMWPTRRRFPLRLRDDRGSATAWAIGIVAVVALLAGAVLDGGNAMAARVQALDIAQQAARAGANQLDLGALREHGVVRLDPGAAQAAAAAFLSQAGATGTATATANEVTVTVTRSQPTLLLQAVGVTAISMKATATAVPQTGP